MPAGTEDVTEETLTGRWIGRYDYGDGGEVVPFEADMVQDGLELRAETLEPNTFRPGGMAELRGLLTGWIVGDEVRLTKTYTFDQGGEPEYVGRISASRDRIAGRWSFENLPGVSGRFSMNRKPKARRRTVEWVYEEIPF